LSEETAQRIATALESIALTMAILLPGEEAPPEDEGLTVMTQEGPVRIR
jgi:hypothetical protein